MPYTKDYIIINIKGSVNEKIIESKRGSKSFGNSCGLYFVVFIIFFWGFGFRSFWCWCIGWTSCWFDTWNNFSAICSMAKYYEDKQKKKLTIQEFPGLSLFRGLCRLPELVPFLLTNSCTLFIAWFTTICSWWEWPNLLLWQFRLNLILQFRCIEVCWNIYLVHRINYTR